MNISSSSVSKKAQEKLNSGGAFVAKSDISKIKVSRSTNGRF
jgi:hypothetical protein